MSAAVERYQGDNPELREAAELLGGSETLSRLPESSLDAHELLARGLPPRALEHLLDHLLVLKPSDALERAIGMSGRTLQRRRQVQAKLLDTNQSIRTWVFAKILGRATAVFGSQEEAERWLAKRDAKLEWIYASRTYRATIPLRWLGMKLGGKKPGHWAGGGSRSVPGGDKRHAG